MLRFLFGRVPWVVWYIVMWSALVISVLLPTLAFLPLKKPGEKPDTPSLGSVFFVLLMAGVLGVVTLVNAGVFTRAHTCEYHDHTAMGVPAFQGRIVIR